MNSTQLSPAERLALLSLAFAYALRMLGLYLVLPVLSPYVAGLPHGASLWVGMAVGAYGLAQAIFQVPFGWLSDHYGRRQAILAGTGLFILGCLLGAVGRTAPVIVLARFLQGMGAIASVVVAMVADLARPAVRQRAMSTLGVVIGLSFAVGLMGGPAIAAHFGVPALFQIGAGLGVVSALGILFFVPEPPRVGGARPTLRQSLATLRDPRLLKVNVAMLSLHLALTGLFVILPLRVDTLLPRADAWQVYAPAIAAGLAALLITAELVDRRHLDRQALAAGAVLLVAGSVLLKFGFATRGGLTLGALVYVLGFAVIEPILPALVTHYSAPEVRGMAAGAFSMSQFAGAALGGLGGAWFVARRPDDLFWMMAALGGVILLVAWRLPNPRAPQSGGASGRGLDSVVDPAGPSAPAPPPDAAPVPEPLGAGDARR